LQDALKASDELIEKMKGSGEPPAGVDQYLADAEEDEAEKGQADQPDLDQGEPPADKQDNAPDPDLKAEHDRLRAAFDTLENKYKVLEGKYKAEVPRYAEEVRNLKQQIEALQSREPAQPEPSDEDVTKIKRKLLDTYTEEEVEALESLIRHMAKPQSPPPRDDSELKELRDELASMKAMTREQQLTAMVPDWQDIEKSEAQQWVAFLKEVNPETGQERNVHLREAWQAGDIRRVAKMFEMYKSRKRPAKPGEPPIEAAGNSTDRTPPQKDRKVWKASEINEISKLYKSRAFVGREKEYEALRDRIERATAEGRVDYNR
jgi:hypothetical protein